MFENLTLPVVSCTWCYYNIAVNFTFHVLSCVWYYYSIGVNLKLHDISCVWCYYSIFKPYMSCINVLLLQEILENQFRAVEKFVDTHAFFSNMSSKFKRLLQLSLHYENFAFNTPIITQGDRHTALFFIIRYVTSMMFECVTVMQNLAYWMSSGIVCQSLWWVVCP